LLNITREIFRLFVRTVPT